jgi:RecJ-like exonuclease
MAGKLLVNDECMQVLEPKLLKLANHLRKAVEEGKFFAIRYHNDCDGICAGLLVHKALKALSEEIPITSIPSGPAVYSLRDAITDISNLNDSRETILLIVDHGANTESLAALKMLKSAGVELIILDHHPFDRHAEKLTSHFITPMNSGGTSSHTAGLLCFELAKLLVPDSADINLAYYSLQSDKSSFAIKDKEFKEPVALDYISTFEELTLPVYETILENTEMISEAYLQAKEKIEIALKQSEKYTDVKTVGEYHVVLVKVSKFMKKGEFPTRGKVMNEIIAKKERELVGKPLVCLGIVDESISFRANAPALALGFDANLLIQDLKKIFGSEIQNGGGHSAAAALQAQADAIPAITREILSLIEK